MNISIHAPSRERPPYSPQHKKRILISIHAPSRERRMITKIPTGCTTNFNPRSLTGATPYKLSMDLSKAISIHAPSRERLNLSEKEILEVVFQSTLPHGSDLKMLLFMAKAMNFNPRSLTGATTELNIKYLAIIISIHAPSRERPLLFSIFQILFIHFNPRSLTGATF